MSHKVRAVEYRTEHGNVRGWWTDCARDGRTMTAWAVRVPELGAASGRAAPWLTTVKTYGQYGWTGLGMYGSLIQARMWVLGGNGHIHRGHSSIVDVRRMSRPNILALTATKHARITPETIPAPWR